MKYLSIFFFLGLSFYPGIVLCQKATMTITRLSREITNETIYQDTMADARQVLSPAPTRHYNIGIVNVPRNELSLAGLFGNVRATYFYFSNVYSNGNLFVVNHLSTSECAINRGHRETYANSREYARTIVDFNITGGTVTANILYNHLASATGGTENNFNVCKTYCKLTQGPTEIVDRLRNGFINREPLIDHERLTLKPGTYSLNILRLTGRFAFGANLGLFRSQVLSSSVSFEVGPVNVVYNLQPPPRVRPQRPERIARLEP